MPLTMGNREYSDAELQRMQRDAEDRVREMQERTKQAAAQENGAPPPTGRTGNRNWSHWSGGRRVINRSPAYQQEQHRAAQRQAQREQTQEYIPSQPQQQYTTQTTQQAQKTQDAQQTQQQHAPRQAQQHAQQHRHPRPHPPQPPHPPAAGPRPTVIEELMGALNLDEDYLLILGLMLILINQRADTTIILALAYLLI